MEQISHWPVPGQVALIVLVAAALVVIVALFAVMWALSPTAEQPAAMVQEGQRGSGFASPLLDEITDDPQEVDMSIIACAERAARERAAWTTSELAAGEAIALELSLMSIQNMTS